MCGIGGIVEADKRKHFDKSTQLSALSLLFELEDRGKSAWGVYLEKVGKKDNNLYCGKEDKTLNGELFKLPDSVDKYFKDKEGKIYLDGTNMILMHTRAYTDGDPKYNMNNHPFNTKNYILAHNGIIRNYKEILQKFKINTKIECDSYGIVALIQHFKDEGKSTPEAIQDTARELKGSYACWLYDKDDKSLYLFRNSSPLEYYIDETNGLFIFASKDEYILNSYDNDNNLSTSDIKVLEREKIFKLEKNTLKEVGKLSSETSNLTPYYANSGYSDRFSNTYDLGVREIRGSLVSLYKIFKKYETSDRTNKDTIISVMEGKVILLIKPKKLIDILDKCGFSRHKSSIQTPNSEYTEYVIKPKEKINSLAASLYNEIHGTSDSLDKDTAYKDLAEELDCDVTIDENEIQFIYNKVGDIPDWIIKCLKKRGLSFKKDKTLSLSTSSQNMDKLDGLLKDMKLI